MKDQIEIKSYRKVIEPSFPSIIRKTISGKFRFEVNARRMNEGQYIGVRKCYKTEEEAWSARAIFATEHLLDRKDTTFDLDTMAFIQKAKERLKPFNVSVQKALDDFIKIKEEESRILKTKTLKTVWEEYLKEAEDKGSRPNTIRSMREMQKKMFLAFGGDTPVGMLVEKKNALIGSNQVAFYFKNRLNEYSQNTKDNIRRYFSAFFNFCFRQGYIEKEENPLRRMVGKRTRKDPEVLSVEQCKKLLEVAEQEDPSIAGIVALMLFGGLRPEEAKQIEPSDIDWKNKEVLIKKDVSKTKRSRTYDLISPLHEWLMSYPQLEKTNLRKRLEKIRLKAGFSINKEDNSAIRWTPDVCRHTAISFRLAKENYAYGKCAVLFGNSEQVIRDHYQAFTRPKDGEVLAFYTILPSSPARNA
jgi:integrase